MNIKKLIGYLLLALLVIGMTIGFVCIFHFIGNYNILYSMFFVVSSYGAAAALFGIVLLITWLLWS